MDRSTQSEAPAHEASSAACCGKHRRGSGRSKASILCLACMHQMVPAQTRSNTAVCMSCNQEVAVQPLAIVSAFFLARSLPAPSECMRETHAFFSWLEARRSPPLPSHCTCTLVSQVVPGKTPHPTKCMQTHAFFSRPDPAEATTFPPSQRAPTKRRESTDGEKQDREAQAPGALRSLPQAQHAPWRTRHTWQPMSRRRQRAQAQAPGAGAGGAPAAGAAAQAPGKAPGPQGGRGGDSSCCGTRSGRRCGGGSSWLYG